MAGPDRAIRKVHGGSLLGNDWEVKTREKIQGSKIVNRLISFFNGEIILEPAQATVGIALLKKVLPDISFMETKATITHNVIRAPALANDTNQWIIEHVPDEHRLIEN